MREVETMHGGTGHSEIRIENLRVPQTNVLGGRGQGHRLGHRLGPSRHRRHDTTGVGVFELRMRGRTNPDQ